MSTQWYEWTGELNALTGMTLNSFTSMGVIPAGQTLKRTRLDVRMNVLGTTTGAATGFDIGWWQDVRVGIGVFLTQGAVSAPNPPTWDASATSGDWVLWGMHRLRVEVYDLGTPYCQLVAEPVQGTLESFGQRNVTGTNVSALWLVWHIIDPSGLIGTTTAGGIKWSAGRAWAAHVLTKTTGT